jgi:hypothetical protein
MMLRAWLCHFRSPARGSRAALDWTAEDSRPNVVRGTEVRRWLSAVRRITEVTPGSDIPRVLALSS